jgi:hypothetical protein
MNNKELNTWKGIVSKHFTVVCSLALALFESLADMKNVTYLTPIVSAVYARNDYLHVRFPDA